MTTPAMLDQVLTQVAATIVGLANQDPTALPGITPTNIVSMLSGEDQGGKGPVVNGYPCVVVCYTSKEYENPATMPSNLTNDWVFPAVVFMISNENGDQITNRQRNWLWRQTIGDAFHDKRLLGLIPAGQCLKCTVDYQTPVSRPRWLQQQHFQAMIVNVIVRRYRP